MCYNIRASVLLCDEMGTKPPVGYLAGGSFCPL